MKFVFILIVAGFISMDCYGQSKTKFHSQNFVGLLEGKAGSKFQLLSINGLERGTWFGGVGTGLDYYHFRSVPLFVSVNKFLCPCSRSLFFSVDGGYNFVWDENSGNSINGFRNGNFDPSLYWGAGFGYRVSLKNKKDALIMSLGFSAKHAKEEIKSTFLCFFPPCPETTEVYKYKFNRLSLRLGWEF